MNNEQISKYLSDELNETEKTRFENELNSNQVLKNEFKKYLDIWENFEEKEVFVDTEKAWNNVSNSILTSKKNFNIYLRVASILLVLSIGFIWMYKSESYNYYETDSHNTEQIQLVDGSVVKLNKNSSITYFRSLNDSVRFVFLKGEAFFDVVKSKIPFIVKTDQATIKVLGTKFSVKESRNKTMLTVEEGKVAFKSNKKTNRQILTAGKRSYCLNGEKLLPIELIDTQFLWYQEAIFFDNKPIQDVFKILSDGFGVNIKIPNKIKKDIRVTARFSKDQTIKTILNAIQTMYDIHILHVNDSTFVAGDKIAL